MNKEAFYNYIEQPEILDEKSLKDLSDLLADYPYFQAAQMLYSKNLHNINHVKYDSQLKLTSAYIYNRRKLFQLINLKPKQTKEEVPYKNVSNEKIENTIENKNIEVVEELSPEIEEPIINEKRLIISDENNDDNQNINESDLIDVENEIIFSDEEVLQIEENVQLEKGRKIEPESEQVKENLIADNFENIVNISENNVFQDENKLENNVDNQIGEELTISENRQNDISPDLDKIDDGLNSENTLNKTSNIADEILQRVANNKKESDKNNIEKTESIADIILRKSALAKSKRENEKEKNEIKTIESEVVQNISEENKNIADNENIPDFEVETNIEISLEINEKPEDKIINQEAYSVVTEKIEKEIIANENVEPIVENQIIEKELTSEIEITQTETIIKNENLAFNDWFNVLKGSSVNKVETYCS